MPKKTPESAFIAHHLATLAGLALAIAGGVEAMSTDSASDVTTGIALRKAGAIVLMVVFLIAAAYSIYLFTRRSLAWHGDRKMLYAVNAALPFILIRAIYLILVAFDSKSKTFNGQQPNVFAQAFLQVVMEFIAFAIFIAAGLTSPSVSTRGENELGNFAKAREGTPSHDAELGAIASRRQ